MFTVPERGGLDRSMGKRGGGEGKAREGKAARGGQQELRAAQSLGTPAA